MRPSHLPTQFLLFGERYHVWTPGEVDLCFRFTDGRWQWKTAYASSAWYPVENLDGTPDDELLT